MIDVTNLTKRFGVHLAVDDISFQVDQGEVVGFLGPNGAGKTTTMRMLTCFLPPSAGQARVAGFDVIEDSMEVRRQIGYLPESVPLYNEMRVQEYLKFRSKIRGIARADRKKRTEYVMDRCGIGGVRRKLCGTLSKGYRQRVGLADAMIHDPPILVLDEPTVGLDPIQIREVRALIAELGENRTILVSTHILPEVEMVCGRVLIINNGRIALDTPLAALKQDAVITVEVRGPESDVVGALKALDGVTEVKPVGGEEALVACEVRATDDRDLREQVAESVTRNGWAIRQLDRRRRTLEDHFIEVTAKEEGIR